MRIVILAETPWLVFWVIAVARFLLPLAIPRYPLPGIIVSLVLDGVDQTIFQQFPGISLEGYQGYDKALDTYYLTIAYISTLRNWENRFAFRVSRCLFYWRLAGVVLFELTHLRALLLVFPNVFEYFFIFCEAYRFRWDPTRMRNKVVIGAAAFIWIVIKLPQEYWIHIAQIDTTDWIKASLFRVPLSTSWGEIVQTWPLVCVIALVVMVLILAAAWWLLGRRLPPADRARSFSADAHQPAFTTEQVRSALTSEARKILDAAMVEKIILVSLMCLCFAQVLPDIRASNLQLVVGIALIVVLNTVLSHWLARRGFGWVFTLTGFVVLSVANSAVMLVYAALRTKLEAPVSAANVLFFVVLLTLLVTLFDRYRQVHLMRSGEDSQYRWGPPEPDALTHS
jgi:hypothetical protein